MSKVWSVQIGGWLRRGTLDVDRDEVRRQLRPHEDCEVTITIEPAEARRSNQANRYLWALYREIEAETGQCKEDIHDEMKVRFTTETISYPNKHTGEMVEMQVVRGTRGMTVAQFYRFVENVKLFSAEFFGMTFEDAPSEYYKDAERAFDREQKRKEVA